ncbi:D-inositol-3-phosphate glycosyltransferase [Janibacter alkaliphilus]|uniref:D-inositol-3-phosphate glycosyltransferase n=1 Tax=Janibacter alkaliphilus TaxID=1069963 RepID=A0A852X3B6_9MICO|nr:D-inositol-3-phosphate glycosyltransferase [Janibacter alkaliphilus]NYG36928.1 D-inositol-3-phosphate glycosyltransferase [Janibacter alkaliphilus]
MSVQRVAMLSVHTSPLDQPGSGDAGGMNVYVVETARQLAARGVEVEIFTRRTAADQPATVPMAPGVVVHHVDAGPYEGLSKDELPGQLCAFTAGLSRVLAAAPDGYYDVVHSHYWLSGQVGWLVADRWRVPLVHTMHTMARVKNAQLAADDVPEPPGREIGEAQVVEVADRLVASTDREAEELVDLYAADPASVVVVPPGVDLTTFAPGDQDAAREGLAVPADALLLLYVGRIQPLKAPDVLVRAAAELLERRPELRERLHVAVLGGASGRGLEAPDSLRELAAELGVDDVVHLHPPVSRETLAAWYRAADVVAVPSYNESFGLVAVEAQASGAVVLAADRGGLPTAVGDAGILLGDHDSARWAAEITRVLDDPALAAELSVRARAHAQDFGWDRTTDRLLEVYRGAVAERAAREATTNPQEAIR